MADVKYQVFINMKEYAGDKEWEQILEEAARGNFMNGISYNNNIVVKTGNRSTVYKLDSDPEKAFAKFKKAVKKIGYTSELDKKTADTVYMENQTKGWKAIKSEKMKLLYINFYIDGVVQKYKLDINSANDLKHKIFLNYILNKINFKDICMKDGYIQSINGFDFAENTNKVKIYLGAAH